MISFNNSQTEIKSWQFFLIQQGFRDVGSADGHWGINTETATKEFQKSQNLNPD